MVFAGYYVSRLVFDWPTPYRLPASLVRVFPLTRSLIHKGIAANLERLEQKGTHQTRYWVVFLMFMRIVFIVVVGTISQHKRDPEELALIGLCLIIGQLILRILGDFAYPIDEEEQEDKHIERIANYANTRIHS
jgi:hypothetical protein